MRWYFEVLKKYIDFNGRASRSEFWWFFIIDMTITFVLFLIDFSRVLDFGFNINLLTCIYTLITILPFIAVCVRRFHDIGKSGFWVLIGLVPYIGVFLMFTWFILDSDIDDNDYGRYPKESHAEAFRRVHNK